MSTEPDSEAELLRLVEDMSDLWFEWGCRGYISAPLRIELNEKRNRLRDGIRAALSPSSTDTERLDAELLAWMANNVCAITTRDEFGTEREWPKEYFCQDDTLREFLDQLRAEHDAIAAASLLSEGAKNG